MLTLLFAFQLGKETVDEVFEMTYFFIIHENQVEWPDLVKYSPNLVEFVWNLVTKLTKSGHSKFNQDVQSDALNALGQICIRHYNFMLETTLKQSYIDILQEAFYSTEHKIKVKRFETTWYFLKPRE